MKFCTRCKIEKEDNEFYKNRKTKDGLGVWCKICEKEFSSAYAKSHREKIRGIHKRWRDKNAEHVKEKSRQNNRKIKLDIIKAYGNKCACCGETRQEFLAIDHINGGGNEERRKTGLWGGISFYLFLRRNGYPKGYRVLCHNCNMSIGMFGYCPHQTQDKPIDL